MKSIFIYIVIHLLIVNSITAQDEIISVQSENNRVDYGAYYFYFPRALSENKKNAKGVVFDGKDTLALFISDSINFHKQNRYIHQQHPHSCQNRLGKFGFINSEDQVIITFEFDYIQDRYDSLFLTAKKKRYGVIDGKGNVVVPFEYSQVVHIFSENSPAFCLRNNSGKIGLLNKDLQTVIPFEYGAFYRIDSTMLALKKNENDSFLSFYNKKGNHLFLLPGFSAKERAVNYISVSDGYGTFNSIADKKGKWIVPPGTYAYVAWIWNDRICVQKKDHFGVINLKGKLILPFEYSRISPTTNKQFIVYKNGMSGVVNLNNEFIIPLDSIGIFNFGVFYFVRRYNSTIIRLIDYKGKQILSEKYSFGDVIRVNAGKEGIEEIDPKSTIIVRDLTNRLMGLFRADGIQVLPVSYYYINHQPDKYAILVAKKSESDSNSLQYATVDINGKFITPFTNNVLSFLPDAPDIILSTNQDRKAAFMNAKTGEIVTPYEFDADYQNKLKNGYIAAKKGWFYAIVLPDGKKLTEAVYRDVYMPTAKNRLWFDEEIICIVKRNEILLGLTKTGKEISKVR